MAIISGIVACNGKRPIIGAARTIIAKTEAPHYTEISEYNDPDVSIAMRYQSGRVGLYCSERFIVAFDGRIDNLTQFTASIGSSAENASVGATLARAFEKYGTALANKIDGKFVLVIWDRREKTLYCARDRFGHRPFCYAEKNGSIQFASDFLPLAEQKGSDLRINSEWVVQFINGIVADKTSTPYEGIVRLAPASFLNWKHQTARVERYWTLANVPEPDTQIPIEEIESALIDSISNSIELGETASLLSGGLDSSSITVFAREINAANLQTPWPTFSLVFDDFPDECEREYIEAMVATGGILSHFVNVSQYETLASMKRIVEIQGSPVLSAGTPVFDKVAQSAQLAGFKTILDGHGGDETISISGAMKLHEYAKAGKWASLLKEILAIPSSSKPSTSEVFFKVYGASGVGLLSNLSRRMRHTARGSASMGAERPELLADHWRDDEVTKLVAYEARQSSLQSHSSERSYQEWLIDHPVQVRALEDKTRGYRMRGLIGEFPFWDKNLIALCLRAPSSQKLKNGVSRHLIRSVLGDRLPSKVLNRSDKLNFRTHLHRGLKRDLDEIRDIKASSNQSISEFINLDAYDSAIENLSTYNEQSSFSDAFTVWKATIVAIWMDLYRSISTQVKEPLEIPL